MVSESQISAAQPRIMVVRLCYRDRPLQLLLFLPQKHRIYFPTAGHVAITSVTSAKVSVNGVHLHYQHTGEGEHAVLLLPGMLGSGEIDFVPQLKNLRYGHSRYPDIDFSVDFFERDAKDAVDLMKMLKFKKVSLLGWSDVSSFNSYRDEILILNINL
uniref:Uncharacterized protein n=1 Tax=Sciurus vulgaris TaxID=55149 RepID=A0A8D2JCP7_SCIVU